jgi:hypothetical protein
MLHVNSPLFHLMLRLDSGFLFILSPWIWVQDLPFVSSSRTNKLQRAYDVHTGIHFALPGDVRRVRTLDGDYSWFSVVLPASVYQIGRAQYAENYSLGLAVLGVFRKVMLLANPKSSCQVGKV